MEYRAIIKSTVVIRKISKDLRTRRVCLPTTSAVALLVPSKFVSVSFHYLPTTSRFVASEVFLI
ncbi:MAG: hypothetical protein N3G79_02580 [Sulfolobales archaeon]|nr:hypothetical protein [Sulfolobales archaeon]